MTFINPLCKVAQLDIFSPSQIGQIVTKPPKQQLDDSLQSWEELTDFSWPTLLLGNGFSVNLWKSFNYRNLKAQAKLSKSAQSLFSILDTVNFEHCLQCLHHAQISLEALSRPTTEVESLYTEIRNSLIEAVHRSHARWMDAKFALATIERELRKFDSIFTTNYDLVPYWSLMGNSGELKHPVVDFFWSRSLCHFDIENTDTSKTPKLHYLHGALHLWRDRNSETEGKWTREQKSLLGTLKGFEEHPSRQPLCVSEGSSGEKMQTIDNSKYLTFCLNELSSNNSNTVIIGHSFPQQDKHIFDALKEGKGRRKFAISILSSESEQYKIDLKAKALSQLSGHDVYFFDSATHPLGDRKLSIT